MKLKSLALPLIVAALIGAGMTSAKTPTRGRMIKRPLHIENKTGFVQVHGPNLIKPDGSQLFIIGTNLGNWLQSRGIHVRIQPYERAAPDQRPVL